MARSVHASVDGVGMSLNGPYWSEAFLLESPLSTCSLIAACLHCVPLRLFFVSNILLHHLTAGCSELRWPQRLLPCCLLGAWWALLLFCSCGILCSAEIVVAPCGGALVLTPRNASNATVALRHCTTETVIHVVGEPDYHDETITNLTLHVSHSTDIWVRLAIVRVVNFTVLFSSVSYANRSTCPFPSLLDTCSVVDHLNATVKGSTYTFFDISTTAENGVALWSSVMSRVAAAAVTINGFDSTNVSSGHAMASVVVHESLLEGCHVSLQRLTMHATCSVAAIFVSRAAWYHGFVSLNDSMFSVEDATRRPSCDNLPVLFVDSSNLKHVVWSVGSVSFHADTLVVQPNSTSIPLRNISATLFKVSRTDGVGASVSLASLNMTNALMFSLVSNSSWAHSSVVLFAFRSVMSNVALLSPACGVSIGGSLLKNVTVSQSSGLVTSSSSSLAANTTNGVFVLCVVNSRVLDGVLAVQHVAALHTTSVQTALLPPDSRTDEFLAAGVGVVAVRNSTLHRAELDVFDALIMSTVAPLVVHTSELLLTRVAVRFSNFTSPRGAALFASALQNSSVMFHAAVLTAHTQTLAVTTTAFYQGAALSLVLCNITAVSDTAIALRSNSSWHHSRLEILECLVSAPRGGLDAEHITWTSSSVVLRQTNIRAASNALTVAWSVLSAAHIVLTACTISSLALPNGTFALRFSLCVVTNSSSVTVRNSSVGANSSALWMAQTWIAESSHVSVVDSNITAWVQAFVVFSTNVSGSSRVEVLHCDVSANASDAVFVDSCIFEHSSGLTFIHSTVSSGTDYACEISATTWLSSSLQMHRVVLYSSSYTMSIVRNHLEASHVVFADCTLLALGSFTASVAYSQLLRNSSVVFRASHVSAGVSDALRFQHSFLSSTSVALTECNVSAGAGFAWYWGDTNLTAHTTILVDGATCVAASQVVGLERILVMDSLLRVFNSTIQAARQLAMFMLNTTWANSIVDMHSSNIRSSSRSCYLHTSNFTGTNVTLMEMTIIADATIGFYIQNSRLSARTVFRLDASFLSAHADGWTLSDTAVIENASVGLHGCTVVATTTYAVSVSQVTAVFGSFFVRACALRADSDVLVVQHSHFTTSYMLVADSNVTASKKMAVVLATSHMSAASVLDLRRCLLQSRSHGVYVENSVFMDASQLAVLDNAVRVETEFCVLCTGVSFVASNVTMDDCSLRANSNALQFHQSSFASSSVALLDSSLVAGSSSAFLLTSSNFTASDVAVVGTVCESGKGGVAVKIELCILLAATTVSFTNSVLDTAGSCSLYIIASNATASSVVVRNTSLFAFAGAMQIMQCNMTSVAVTLLDSDLYASLDSACHIVRSLFAHSRVVVEHTSLYSNEDNAFAVQTDTVIAFTFIAFISSNLTAAGSYAAALHTVHVNSSSIIWQHSSLLARTDGLLLYQTHLTESSIRLEDSTVMCASSYSVYVLATRATKSLILLQRATVSASQSSAVVVAQCVMSALNVTVIDSFLSVSTSTAFFLQSTALLTSHVLFVQSALHAQSTVFLMARSSLVASNVTLYDTSVTARQQYAWSALLTSVLVGSSIAFRRVALMAPTNVFALELCTLQSCDIILDECKIFALSSSTAMYFVDVNVSGSHLVVDQCQLNATSNAVRFLRTFLASTDVAFRNSNVTVTSSQVFVLAECDVATSSFLLLRNRISAFSFSIILQRSTFAASHVSLLDCSVSALTYVFSASGSKFRRGSTVLFRATVLQALSVVLYSTESEFTNATLLLDDCVVLGSLSYALSAFATVFSEHSGIHIQQTFIEVNDSDAALHFKGASFASSNVTLTACRVWCSAGSLLKFSNVTATSSTLVVASSEAVTDGGLFVAADTTATKSLVFSVAASLVSSGCSLVSLSGSSDAQLLTVRITETNVSRRTATTRSPLRRCHVVEAVASRSALSAVAIDASRFADFDAFFHTNTSTSSTPSSLTVSRLTVFCSWWLSAARVRPMTKLNLGSAAFVAQLPSFLAYSIIRPDSICAVATLSASQSETRSALLVSATVSRLATVTFSDGSTRTWMPTPSKSLTASAPPPTATLSSDATATPLIVRRAVRERGKNHPGDFAAAIGAAMSTASLASLWSGMPAQRVAFTLRSADVDCSAQSSPSADSYIEDAASSSLDWLSSPTRLDVGDLVGAAHRGAVLGNVAVCAAAAAVAAVVVRLVARATGQRSYALMTRLHVRQAVSIPVVVLLQPTFASAVALLQLAASSAAHRDAETVGFGVLGAFFAAAGVAAAAYLLDPRAAVFRARADALPRVTLQRQGGGSDPDADNCPSVAAVYRWWAAESVAWRPRAGHAAFVAEWGFLFDELCTRRQWWPLADAAVSLAMAGLDAAVAGGGSGCVAAKWAVVAVACAAVLALLLLAPLNSRRAQWSAVALAALVALIALLGVFEADDAVIRALGIVAVVLQWCPTLLLLSERCCADSKRNAARVSDEWFSGDLLIQAGSSSMRKDGPTDGPALLHRFHQRSVLVRGDAVATATARITRQAVAAGHRDPPHPAARSWRQRAALQALVALICSEQQQKLLKLMATEN